jgi:hypothetical protein
MATPGDEVPAEQQPAPPFDELQCHSPDTPSAEPQHSISWTFLESATGLHFEAEQFAAPEILKRL